jgi:alkylation response protein AidB-like acyl-CoA dehydrogenase
MLGRMAALSFAMEAVTEAASGLADAGRSDIRLEAAIAKMFNSEGAWRIVDDLMQIRGGRGYETAESLASRGEPAIPVERVCGTAHQSDLRGIERGHAAVHRARSGGPPPAERGGHGRPQGLDG